MSDHYYRRGNETYNVRLKRRGDRFTADVEGTPVKGKWQELSPGYFQVDLPEHTYKCFVAVEGDSLSLFHEGAVYTLSRYDPRDEIRARRRGLRSGGGSGDHLCPLAGKVLQLIAREGARVAQGEPLMIVEAMKMEHTIKAHQAGTLTRFNYQPGQSVEAGVKLLELEPRDEVTRDEVTRDEVTRDEVTRDEVTRDEVTRDEVTRDEVTRDGVTRDGVPRDEVTRDGVTRDEVTRDEVTREEA